MSKDASHKRYSRSTMNTANLTILTLALGVGILIGYIFSASTALGPMTEYQMSGHGMHASMEAMTRELTGKTGDELDRVFLDEMIVHHEGAVQMARRVAGSARPELRAFANQIIEAQTQEITDMRAWRSAWFEGTAERP